MKNTFKKSERLSKKILIKELFDKGSSFYLHPFKVYHLKSEAISVNQILVSVPKRNFKKAVDRNKLKRRIREAYRLNKQDLTANCQMIAYIYIGKKSEPYHFIEQTVVQSLKKVSKIAGSEG